MAERLNKIGAPIPFGRLIGVGLKAVVCTENLIRID